MADIETTLALHGERIGVHASDLADIKRSQLLETESRIKGDEVVHGRINGLYKMGFLQLAGLALALLLLLLKN